MCSVNTPLSQTVPALHCLVWCVHGRTSFAVCLSYIKACSLLCHSHYATASLVHVLLLLRKPFTDTGSLSFARRMLNILLTPIPCVACLSVDFGVCVVGSQSLCGEIFRTSLHLEKRPS